MGIILYCSDVSVKQQTAIKPVFFFPEDHGKEELKKEELSQRMDE